MIAAADKDLYLYEIHALVREFFPGEEVKVVLESQYSPDQGEPFLRVSFGEKQLRMSFACGVSGEAEAPDGVSFAEKSRVLRDAVKHMLYAKLSEITGRTLPWGELIGIRPTKLAMNALGEGMSKAEAAELLMNEHKVSREKAFLAADIAGREREILSGIDGRSGYSLYIGIPFCPTTCLYCSFTSYPLAAWQDRVDEYLDALEREMACTASLFAGRYPDTVYIGGGTPTTLSPSQLARLIGAVRKYFPFDRVKEFTVEAGRPDSITKEKLLALRDGGVGRISVNPQTMNDETLKLIGRRHDTEAVRRAYSLARETGFDNINMDIILGLPGEGEKEVSRTISEIGKMRPDDLTVHSLALKRGSKMLEWIVENGAGSISNTDSTMRIAAEGAAEMGLVPYYLYRQKNMSGNFENVGYASEGKYGIYNILIMEEVESIAALGAGAISKAVFPDENRIERAENNKDLKSYLENIDEMCRRKERLFGT